MSPTAGSAAGASRTAAAPSWNSLAAGVPWAALEICDQLDRPPRRARAAGAREDRRHRRLPRVARPQARRPRRCSRSATPPSPGTSPTRRPPSPPRGRRSRKLKGVKTPVFMMQGRRDFAFGLEQALNAYRALAGPKQLWIGLTATRRRTGVAADTPAMLAEGAPLVRPLPARRHERRRLPKPVAISPENWKGQPRRFDGPAEGRGHAIDVRRRLRRPRADRAGRQVSHPAAAAGAPARGLRLAGRVRRPRTRPAAGRASSPC